MKKEDVKKVLAALKGMVEIAKMSLGMGIFENIPEGADGPFPKALEAIALLQAELDRPPNQPAAWFLVSLTDNDGTKHYEQVASEYVNDPDVFPLYKDAP